MIEFDKLPCDITGHINTFRGFLNASWPFLDALMKDHDWDDDGGFIGEWLQVNWEFFVERELLGNFGYLTPLSVPIHNIRVTKPEANPSYTVLAMPEKALLDAENQLVVPFDKSLRLFSFITPIRGGFGFYPPFDYANLVVDTEKKLFTVPINELKFYLTKL